MDFSSKDLQAQKLLALGQLAGGVAHDFNNILSIIEGYTRMASKQTDMMHPAHTSLQHILTATRRGAGLTRQLLSFSRQQILPMTHCDLAKLVRETQILLRPLVTHRINLDVNVPDEIIAVPCDCDMITQILINLVVNARDAIPDTGDIWIELRTTSEHATLIIADNGMGMEPEISSRIFDPFFTTKPQGQGTGLGLSMVSGYMQQIGGDVHLKSKLGVGTTFTLTFPRIQKKNSSADKSPPTILNAVMDNTSPLTKKTILVVEDEEVLLPVLEMQLSELGMKVLKAANADSALLMQHNYPGTIDLLLTDVVMPGISGIKLADTLQQMRPETGVVFMTGYPYRNGMAGQTETLPENALVLPKPLPVEQLSPMLQKALGRIRDRQDD